MVTTRISFWRWVRSTRHCGLGEEVACWFHCWKSLVSFDRSNSTCPIDVNWMGLFLRKKHILRCWGWLSLLNWIGTYIVSIAKTALKKIGALIHSVKLFSPELTLYLYKSTIRPCMECYCHIWAGTPSCYLELLDKLLKWICWTGGHSFATSLDPLTHCQNVASLSLFYRYFFGRCSLELA